MGQTRTQTPVVLPVSPESGQSQRTVSPSARRVGLLGSVTCGRHVALTWGTPSKLLSFIVIITTATTAIIILIALIDWLELKWAFVIFFPLTPQIFQSPVLQRLSIRAGRT